MLIVFFVFIGQTAYGQSYESTDAYTLGRANIKSVSGKSVSAFNSSALNIDSNLVIGLFINNQYALQALSSFGAFARKIIGNGQFSGGISFFGDENYQERRLNTAYALKVQENLRFGVAINAWQFAFREKEANQSILTFSPAVNYVYKDLEIGFFAQNLGLTKESSFYLQESLALGASYYLNNVILSAELEKYSNRKLLTKIAIDYSLNKKISFIYGLGLGEFNQHLGIAFMLRNIRIDVAFFYQNKLGNSSGIGATYKQ